MCATRKPFSQNPTASNAAAAGEESGHIHSLDVNPADDTHYVASHHGVFALGANGFEHVGEERFDAMSFTIAGPDRFLMSGHPEPGAGGPAHFGLSESTDTGRRWGSLSLEEEADFHALEAAGDRVYGVVRLQVSGSPELVESAPRLVLLDWDSEDLLVGAGPEGSVYRSDDGGDSWREVGSLPDVPHALTATESRWYAATEGGVLVSTDAGATWSEVGAG